MKNNRNYRPAGRDKTRPEASRRPARPQSRPQEEESARGMQREDIVIGRNGVIELLKSGRAVESILVTGGETQGSIVKILAMAKEQGIPVKETSPAKLDNMCGHQNHQGVIAVTGAANYSTMEDIYKKAGDQPLFVIIADEITDPHNLGAIIRTAEIAGRPWRDYPQAGQCGPHRDRGKDLCRRGGASAGGAGIQPGCHSGSAQKGRRMGLRHRYGRPVLV